MIKNPYYFNFFWLTVVIIILWCFLFGPCLSTSLCFHINSRWENILLGILSSAFLLLFIEILNYKADKLKYGFLNGRYKKILITQKNDGGLRSSDIPKEELDPITRKTLREQKEINENIKFQEDSCYHELLYYKCETETYLTELNYKYNGIYTGMVEYFNHSIGDWQQNNMTKISATITLNLNLANKMTGVGSYKYYDRDDFGKFEFQVDEQNKKRIIVSYVNTIPSGLSEGYEIWQKV